MLKIHKLYLALKKESLISTGCALVVALVFWYQISPISLSQYRMGCGPDIGDVVHHNSCMDPYWSQYNLDKSILIISSGLSGVFAIIFIINQLSRMSQKQMIF